MKEEREKIFSTENGEEQSAKLEESNNDSELQKEESKTPDWEDRYLRLFADFENFRKRSIKERLDISNSVKSSLVASFIPLLDDLERAVANMTEDDKKSSTFEGVKMLISKFQNILSSLGIMELKIDINNEKLDPSKHEALTTMSVEDQLHKGKIIAVVEKGYTLNNNIVRFAKVIIGE